MPKRQTRVTVEMPFGGMTISWPKLKTDAIEALDMRKTAVALAVSTAVGDTMRHRITTLHLQRDGTKSKGHLITGGMWKGFEARLAKTGVVKIWYARSSASAWGGWPGAQYLPKSKRGKARNRDKAGTAQAYASQVILDPSDGEVDGVTAALTNWILLELDPDATPAGSQVPEMSARIAQGLSYV